MAKKIFRSIIATRENDAGIAKKRFHHFPNSKRQEILLKKQTNSKNIDHEKPIL